MLERIKEKVSDWVSDHEEVIIYGSYALYAGMIIGSLLQSRKTSRDLKTLCRSGMSYHVDAPGEGTRYLFKFGQESLNN